MNGIRSNGTSVKSRRSRTYKVTPMTRAVRSVLAASTLALALGTTGTALAGELQPNAPLLLEIRKVDLDTAPVFDLTVVQPALIGPGAPVQALIGDDDPAAPPAGWSVVGSGPQIVGTAMDMVMVDAGDVHAIHAASTADSVLIDARDAITAQSYGGEAVAIYASAATTTEIFSYEALVAIGYTDAAGIAAFGVDDISVVNHGAITADADWGNAYGVLSVASVGDVSVYNDAQIDASSYFGNATGIDAISDAGNVEVGNVGPINTYSMYGSATGVRAYSTDGNVEINNAAPIDVTSVYGNAIGLYGYSTTGDVEINNNNDISAYSGLGLADGIFASGANVSITNSSDSTITSDGFYWSAGIEAQGTGTVTVTNNAGGVIVASVYAAGGQAFGIYATGDDVTVSNGDGGLILVDGYYATGIEAQGSGNVTVSNAGYVLAGYNGSELATGINASTSGEGASVQVGNDGLVYAAGTYGGTGISATATGLGGAASISNSGYVYAVQTGKYGFGAYGLVASADGDATINNDGLVDVYSGGVANGAVASSFAGDASVTNTGDISVENSAFMYYGANGIVSFSAAGNAAVDNSGSVDVTTKYIGAGVDVSGYAGASVDNSGDITVDAWRAYGIRAASGNGDVEVSNSGSIASTYGSSGGTAFGILATSSNGDVGVDNSGSISAIVTGQAVGMFARSDYGDVTASNSGDIFTYSYDNYSVGIFARADEGSVSVDNSGSIQTAAYYGYALGVLARGGDVAVSNSGDIIVDGFYFASGITANSVDGATVESSGGTITAYALGAANGIDATAVYGDVVIDNASDVLVAGLVYGATGLRGYSDTGDVSIGNTGAITAQSIEGAAIGIYGYSGTGDVSIDNSGDIIADTSFGLADGIFASGANVDVTNSGAISATTYGEWAAGIEAQGAESVLVTNSGDLTATAGPFALVYDYYGDLVAYQPGGQAFGIYAAGGEAGAVVENSGGITVDGGYATGIQAQSYGDTTVTNSGDIVAGSGLNSYYNPATYYSYYYGTQVATGINAASNGEGAHVDVASSGDITVDGIFGATGIAASATGLGGTASISNSGDILASQDNGSGYGAYGVIASADGNADVTNEGGITVVSEGAAAGATALSFAGDASVTNSGDIAVSSTSSGDIAYGIVAFAGYGDVFVDNSGSVYAVNDKYQATAVDARSHGDVNVTNSGSLYANGFKYAFGVYATAASGDVNVDNAADGEIGFYSYLGRGWGVFGHATLGDVNVSNAGVIDGYAFGQSVGVFGVATEGDVNVSNSGSITATTGGDAALGVFARADNGTASVTNSGDITASTFPDTPYVGDVAYGILARGAYAEVANSGDIVAEGFYYATGIAALSVYGTTVTNTGGSIDVAAAGDATAIDAQSLYGNVVVSNASTIDGISLYGTSTGISGYSPLGDVVIENAADVYTGALYGAAIGIYGYSAAGDVTIDNSGDLTTISYYGLADGIFASGVNVDVTNSGAIDTTSAYGDWAVGIEAQGAESTLVTNSGDITASVSPLVAVYDYAYNQVGYAAGGQAFGIYATGGEAGTGVANSGAITVQGGYVTGIHAQSYGDVAVTNSGDIVAGSGLNTYYNPSNYYTYYYGTQVATGINAASNGEGAQIAISSSGDITVDAAFGASGIAATASGYGGTVAIDNSGDIYAAQAQKYGYGAYGVVASADGNAVVASSGAIEVVSGGVGTGIAALSFGGDAGVTNAGDIDVTATAFGYYGATGILAFAGNGEAVVQNSGSVSATWEGSLGASARAVDAQGQQGATVINSGELYANGKYAYGVYAASAGGDVAVGNAATGEIGFYSYTSMGFGVLGIATLGDVDVVNEGLIEGYAYGQSAGVFAVASAGDAAVHNAGTIDVTSGGNLAVGVFARADLGTATITNAGDVVASNFPGTAYTGYMAYGLFARGAYAEVGNSGSILAEGNYYANGIIARSTDGTTVATSAGSEIEATAQLVAIGIEARAEDGDVVVQNGGDITVEGTYGGGVGVQAYSLMGDVSVASGGDVVATSTYGMAIGLSGYSIYANTAVSNSGSVQASGDIGAYGISALSYLGDVTATNTGEVSAESPATAIAVIADAYGDVTIGNAGDITAASDGGLAAAVSMTSATGTSTLNNAASGSISVAEGAYAVLGSDAEDTINNAGEITGSISLYGGDDTINNGSGGLLDLSAATLNLGDGDDTINNLAGGTVLLNDSVITLGDGSGSEAFANAGTLTTQGYGLIDMGGAALTNTGVIDFLDGAMDDVLVIHGDLAGSGSINLDLSLLNQSSDLLYVDGNIASGAVQTVNINISEAPSIDSTPVEFAFVSGTSAASNFVGGTVEGLGEISFLDLGVAVSSDIDAGNASDDVFMLSVDVLGLNEEGATAAVAASGAAGFLNSQVGTFRQRLGVNPYGDAGKVMSGFVRFYTDEGDVNPQHIADNFGQAGSFGYNQSTTGRELGLNANLFGNFHAGVLLGNADSRQRLTGTGIGENRMDGSTFGVYATWYVPNGFYVDVSGRWMDADIRTTVAGGVLESSADVKAYSVEAGYEWNVGGFTLVPQAQYVRTEVENVSSFMGDVVRFDSHGGTSARGRLGVEINKTFQTGGFRITPYASVNAVREFDGESTYTVADDFHGRTSTEGTSTMLDLGVGMQKGGFGFTLGANWTDGGAYDSVIGGQAIVRYAW